MYLNYTKSALMMEYIMQLIDRYEPVKTEAYKLDKHIQKQWIIKLTKEKEIKEKNDRRDTEMLANNNLVELVRNTKVIASYQEILGNAKTQKDK